MALNRITGLGMVMLGSCILYAGCNSGGTTSGVPANSTSPTGGASNNPGTGGAGNSSNTGGAYAGTTGGASTHTGGAANAGGNNNTGGAAPTGGSSSTFTQPAGCVGLTQPTASGTLGVSNGYVTAGTLKGYGFTWVGDKSNATSCITPHCDSTGCSPAFGATALCATGVVTSDTTYASVVGIGFNFNQPSSGGTGSEGNIAAPSTITVTATVGSGTGDSAARVQIVDGSGNNFCVDAGKWTSGQPISITDFYPSCWFVGDATNDPGTPLAVGANIRAIDITVPSDSTSDRAFSICLTGVSTG